MSEPTRLYTKEELRQLVERAVRYPHFTPGVPHWSNVGYMFSVGSTSARELCVAFGVDPDLVLYECRTCGERQDKWRCEECRQRRKGKAVQS